MIDIQLSYEGHKHCRLQHGPSGALIETDAPKDNQGLGQAFSPTDLMAASLGSCMLTIMAMKAEADGQSFTGAKARVEKHMVPSPRRIAKLVCHFQLPSALPIEYRPVIEAAGLGCPVKVTLGDQVEFDIRFEYL